MATYEEIHGKRVDVLDSDPTLTSSYEGQVWYNSASGTLKSVVALNAWASTSPFSTARGFVAHTGTQTASLLCGGLQEPPTTYHSATEEYNGSGWATGGAIPAATYALASAGTQTAGLVFGGANSSDVKQSTTATYNGTAWSATPNSLNTARDQLSGGGTQTSALAVGGRVTSAVVTNMEEWNGSAWTNLTALPEKRGYTHANGPETAFFMASGALGDNSGSPYTNATLNYDGSSISTGANVNTARSAGGAAGDSANAIFFGGDIGGTSQVKTEKYDGTSWAEVGDMAVAKRGSGSGAGTSNTAAISAGAYGPPSSNSSEEFASSINTITAAAWASGGPLNTARRTLGGSGTQTAALAFGGNQGPASTAVNNSEEYNGSSWTEGNNLNTTRYGMGAAGTQTATLALGGANPSGTPQDAVESYNGSSWTAGTAIPTATQAPLSYCGIQTAALVAGGFAPSYTTATHEWDGSSWTSGGALSNAVAQVSGLGIQTAALSMGGERSTGLTSATEEYNGLSWTAGTSLPSARQTQGTSGTQTAGLAFGGQLPSVTSETLGYDGSAWSTRPSLATARGALTGGGAGTNTLAIAMGGWVPPSSAATEEFTGETSAATASTLTTS